MGHLENFTGALDPWQGGSFGALAAVVCIGQVWCEPACGVRLLMGQWCVVSPWGNIPVLEMS